MTVKLHLGDSLEVLKTLQENSVDSLVTDPPAGISFMGKSWDDDKGGRDEWIKWLSLVMEECHRVLKPGAHGLVWAIPRTSHWTAMALEDAGFEVKDTILHCFGSGFPKSLNVKKSAEKQELCCVCNENLPDMRTQTCRSCGKARFQDGYGTALKPAVELWWLIRKPLSEPTVAKNVLKWGTGGINVDGCRIIGGGKKGEGGRLAGATGSQSLFNAGKHNPVNDNQGRFPSNLILSHSEHCTDEACDMFLCPVKMLDEQSGPCKTGLGGITKENHNGCTMSGPASNKTKQTIGYPDNATGASRFFYCAKVSSRERNQGCEGLQDKAKAFGSNKGDGLGRGISGTRIDIPTKNHHPTVKPIKLMSYLCRLITPPNGTIIDPFMGSGSTGMAAIKEGFKFIGIERESEYFQIAEKRIASV